MDSFVEVIPTGQSTNEDLTGLEYILCKITDANGCISNKTRTIIRSTPP
jgi:hypothetical protein